MDSCVSIYEELAKSHHRIKALEEKHYEELAKSHHRIEALEEQHNEELAKSYHRIKALEDQHSRNIARITLLHAELDEARSKIANLSSAIRLVHAELEAETKVKLNFKAANKVLTCELRREKACRVVMEGVVDELAAEIGADRAEVEELKRECEQARLEAEEERKMMRIAEVWREERVRMKLAEANRVLEERIGGSCPKSTDDSPKNIEVNVVGKKLGGSIPLTQNPHILRGIKGFVEFPVVLRRSESLKAKRGGVTTKHRDSFPVKLVVS